MPIYEYECTACRQVFEKIQKIGEGPEDAVCPSCGKGKPKKLVATFRTNAWSQFLDNMERRVNPRKPSS